MSVMDFKKVGTPISAQICKDLKAGDWILLSGWVYSARDQAHIRLKELIEAGSEIPFSLEGEVIYYMGPSPAPPGEIIGSAGPTTSSRMDSYAPLLYSLGLKATLGKGERSEKVKDALVKYGGIYLATVGGAGAYLAERIKKVELVCWQDLGPEAVQRLYVEDFPCVVAYDSSGRDFFKEQRERYKKE